MEKKTVYASKKIVKFKQWINKAPILHQSNPPMEKTVYASKKNCEI